MVDVAMDPKRGLLQDGRTAQEFLEDLFEYEYCTECGGDAEDHIVVLDVLGLFHAHCLNPAVLQALDLRMQQCAGADPSGQSRPDGEINESTLHRRFAERKDRPHPCDDHRTGVMLGRLRALREWLLR
jgi:hypothetical protein